jgi:hypothetical protein
MGEMGSMSLPSDQLLVDFEPYPSLLHSASPSLDRREGELISLDYQDLYRNQHASPLHLPTMAESGLSDWSFYNAHEDNTPCLDLSKTAYPAHNTHSPEVIFEGVHTKDRGSVISSSLKNIEDAITTTNISPSSRGLIERSLHILKAAIEMGDKEDATDHSMISLQCAVGENLEGIATIPTSALAVDEEDVWQALGLSKVKGSFIMNYIYCTQIQHSPFANCVTSYAQL